MQWEAATEVAEGMDALSGHPGALWPGVETAKLKGPHSLLLLVAACGAGLSVRSPPSS